MTNQYREELDPIPDRMKHLPVLRGYPVPWFVAKVNGEYEFRVADSAKFITAIKENRCWVCGGILGGYKAFVIGPMCMVNRTTAEPPSHTECAVFSIKNCPFLSRPSMVRREDEFTASCSAPGEMIKRNPGVTVLWVAKQFKVFAPGNGGYLIQLGDWNDITFYKEGRHATKAETLEAISSGIPLLGELCASEREHEALERAISNTLYLIDKYPWHIYTKV